VTDSLDRIRTILRRLPGLGSKSAERIALHLLVARPQACAELIAALEDARARVARCTRCGGVCDVSEDGENLCEICRNERRDHSLVCVVEQVPDMLAIEKSAAFTGVYHVLHGRLSPVHGIGPAELNIDSLRERVRSGAVSELILALANDVEGEATCHYIREQIAIPAGIRASRIGFGLPSGAGIGYADPTTLRSAIEGRRGL
jgi:recombination protein RecR